VEEGRHAQAPALSFKFRVEGRSSGFIAHCSLVQAVVAGNGAIEQRVRYYTPLQDKPWRTMRPKCAPAYIISQIGRRCMQYSLENGLNPV